VIAIKRLLAAVLLVTVTLPLHADFNAVARAIDGHHGVKRIWIPFLGLARAAVWVVRPKGVHDFQLATFTGADDADGAELQAIMRAKVGPGFTPLVQVRSRKSGEWSFIYAKPSPDTNRVELIVLTHDDDDTVLVRVEVDANAVAREVRRHPRHVSDMASR
jgi:hypothetical protein